MMTANLLVIIGVVLLVLGVLLIVLGGSEEAKVGLALTGTVLVIFGILVLLGPLLGFLWNMGRMAARFFWS